MIIESDKPLNNACDWPTVSVFLTKQYREARIEAHNALFWTARAAHSFLEPTTKNGHLSLFFHFGTGDFRTRMLVDGVQIGLNLSDLELYFCENDEKVPHSFWLNDRTPAFVEAWYLVELLHRGIDQNEFSTVLPFESPDMLMGDTQDHNASLFKKELNAMSLSIARAVALLGKVAASLTKQEKFINSQSQISLEPESFTLVLRIALELGTDKIVLIGFSVGDHLRPTPFFFSKGGEQTSSSKSHILDYEPENLISLRSVEEKCLTENDLVKNLRDKAIGISLAL